MNSYYDIHEFIYSSYYVNSYSAEYEFIHSSHHMNSYLSVTSMSNTCQTMSSIDNHVISSVTNNILRFTEELNKWSSKFIVTHDGQTVDVSSGAMGSESIAPSGIPPQSICYPCSKYRFDETKFYSIAQKDALFSMIMSPTCIDGCRLVLHRPNKHASTFRKVSWTFVCHHGKIADPINESSFRSDCVGKSNVVSQNIKRRKSTGQSVKGTMLLFLCSFFTT